MVHAPSRVKRLNSALPSASMLVAILALVVAAAGAGYAAGKIGTNDIKNNAVTSPKVKNGTLKAADMVKEKKFKYVGSNGAPSFRNGGQGDCVWQHASSLAAGLGKVGYRKDRFGTVHLTGLAGASDGLGGDGVCDSTEFEDITAFRLPAEFRPARTSLRSLGNGSTIIVVGAVALNLGGGDILPAGAVATTDPTFGLLLDGISYQPAGSKLVSAPATTPTRSDRRSLRRTLGLD